MKRYIICLLLIFSAAITFAAPEPYSHLEHYDRLDKQFFKKFLYNQGATYKICTQENGSEQYIPDEKANEIFTKSINNWLDRTRHYILKNKAEEQFRDILDFIDGPHNLKQIPCDSEEADLNIYYTKNPTPCGRHAGGCIDYFGNIYLKVRDFVDRLYLSYTEILTHELGHAFGLGDEYSGAIYRGSFLYNSKISRPTIMGSQTYKVTCDDADGFITSIDRLQGTHREFYSLCKDGLFIKDGQGVIEIDDTYSFEDNLKEFDAKVKISYPQGLDDSYIVDMTLDKFILDDSGMRALSRMGFDAPDLNSIRHAVVKIHGMVSEPPYRKDSYTPLKKPIGLWTLVLYDKRGMKEKQSITKDFFDEGITIKFENFEQGTVFFLNNFIQIPLIDSFHETGCGDKEDLRMKNILRSNLDKAKKKLNKNTN